MLQDHSQWEGDSRPDAVPRETSATWDGHLDPHESKLPQALRAKDESLARMYRGPIAVLAHVGNPDRHPQAAHSLRELMEKMPKLLDVATPAHNERLGAKVRDLQTCWEKACRNSAAHDGGEWRGCIRIVRSSRDARV